MATAILRCNHPSPASVSGSDVEAVKKEIGPTMAFPREAPPPQLPQIPADVWAEVWDDLVALMADSCLKGKELKKMMPFFVCICCCGPCIMFPKMNQFNEDQNQRYATLLQKVQPILAPYGVGVTINMETYGKNGTQSTPQGLRFDGSVQVAGVAQPAQQNMS